MMNSPYLLERFVNEKLDELRAEGIRSQQIARVDLRESRSAGLPDLKNILQALLKFATRFGSSSKTHGSVPQDVDSLNCAKGSNLIIR